MVPESIRDAAAALAQAEVTRVPIAPLSESHPAFTIDDAYAIQTARSAERLADGGIIAGFKVGLTSAAMQRQLGVDQPDFGTLFADMAVEAGAVDLSPYIAPRIEPEIAIILERPLQGPGIDVDDVIAATGTVTAALELIDSRVRDWRITIVDTIADNASSAGYILGSTRLTLDEFDRVGTTVTMSVNGEQVGSGSGNDVLGDPLRAVAWLANTLGERGVTIPVGAVVLPGSVCGAAFVNPGDVAVADFGALGRLEISFHDKETK